MLILTRKIGQKTYIGEDIELIIMDVTEDEDRGIEVKIGIDAPRDIKILREEVLLKQRKREVQW